MRAEGGWRALSDFLKLQVRKLNPATVRDIEVSSRSKELNPKMQTRHPERRARTARVAIAGGNYRLNCPPDCRTTTPFRDGLPLNVVRVWEPDPPRGEPAVEWILWTTEPIASHEDLERIVDIYRARWAVEEYFKAIKTGCRFTTRQLDSFATLTTALALFVPVAWKLLLARSLVKADPDAAADALLSSFQKAFLERRFDTVLSTAREALLAVARYGGHLSRNGDPGWLTIGRGFERLVAGEQFHREALGDQGKCDQS